MEVTEGGFINLLSATGFALASLSLFGLGLQGAKLAGSRSRGARLIWIYTFTGLAMTTVLVLPSVTGRSGWTEGNPGQAFAVLFLYTAMFSLLWPLIWLFYALFAWTAIEMLRLAPYVLFGGPVLGAVLGSVVTDLVRRWSQSSVTRQEQPDQG